MRSFIISAIVGFLLTVAVIETQAQGYNWVMRCSENLSQYTKRTVWDDHAAYISLTATYIDSGKYRFIREIRVSGPNSELERFRKQTALDPAVFTITIDEEHELLIYKRKKGGTWKK